MTDWTAVLERAFENGEKSVVTVVTLVTAAASHE
jgi:hypothetical protein